MRRYSKHNPIPDRVKALVHELADRGLSQSAIGRTLGISQPSVSRILGRINVGSYPPR